MTKVSGLAQQLFITGVDLSGDTGSMTSVHGGPAALPSTGLDKNAMERLGGVLDGAIGWSSFYNVTAGQAHPTLSTLPTTDVAVMYVTAQSIGSPCAMLLGKQPDYAGTRGADGSFTFDLEVLSNSAINTALEWGIMLTAGKRTDTTATNGASNDYGAVSTLFGATAWLHVFSVTGTSMTVTIQDSADNSAWANITGLAFSAVVPGAAPQYQRLQTATGATIRRYVRAITTGTFNPGVFAVGFTRHLTTSI